MTTAPDVPTVADPFRWTSEPWGPALRCRPLEAVARHLFTTRHLPLPDADGWRTLADGLGVPPDRLVRPAQAHGDRVLVLRRNTPRPPGLGTGGDDPGHQRPEADAVVTDDPDLVLAVVAADCVPLLIADAATGAVAAVHAGWRGTAAGIAAEVVRTMSREFGSRPSDLVAALGPSIGGCCYEVGSELVDAFAAAGHDRTAIARWFLAAAPRRGSRERPPLRLDVPAANRDQLVLAGLPEDQIHLSGLCTATNLDVVTSYRAERQQARRIAGVISLLP